MGQAQPLLRSRLINHYYLFNSDFYRVDLYRYKLKQARAEVNVKLVVLDNWVNL